MKAISGSFTITAVEDGENGVNITLDPPSIIAKINKSVAYKVNVEVYDGSTKVPHDQWGIKNSSGATSWTVTDGLSAEVFVDSENGKKGLQLNYWETFDVNTIVLFYVTYNGVDYEKSVSLSTLTNGENAIRVDLDNENDTMLYDGNGNLLSGNVTSQARLYDGVEEKTNYATWIISGVSGTNDYGITDAGFVTVNGITDKVAYLQVRAEYPKGSENYYYAQLTIKKLVNADKYELIVTPNAIAYNETTDSADKTENINIKVYKTDVTGNRSLSNPPNGYYISVYIDDTLTYYNITASEYELSVKPSECNNIRIAINGAHGDDSMVLDSETVPINKSRDGASADPVVLYSISLAGSTFSHDPKTGTIYVDIKGKVTKTVGGTAVSYTLDRDYLKLYFVDSDGNTYDVPTDNDIDNGFTTNGNAFYTKYYNESGFDGETAFVAELNIGNKPSESIQINKYGEQGGTGAAGNTPIVVYMAAYERPNAPTTNYVNEGWSTAYPSSISGLYITHGGLWEKMSDGYYRSPIDFVKHSTEVGEAYAVEERFYFNNTTDNTIYLPFHFVSSSQSGGDYGYIIGTKNAYNQITPILSTEYDANGEPDINDNVYSLSGIDQSLSNYTIIIPSGVSYVIFGYRKNWAGNEGEDLVKVKFGAQPVWQSTVTTKNNTFLSSTQPNNNGSTASLTQMEVKENRLLGSRFAEGRIDAWSVYNGGVSPYRFGKKNIFVRGNAAGYVQGLKQSIVNAVYKGSVYTLSFWGKGTRIRIAANVAYKRTYTIMTSGTHYGETYTDTYTPDTLIERSTIAEPTMWINGKPVQSVAGYVNGDYYSKTPDTSDTGFACALTLYSRVYTMHTVGFKVKDNFDDVSDTTIFPTTGYWTIDGTSYYASISYSFDNAIDLEFSTPDESDDYGNIQTYGFNLLMPKLEAGSYPTEFNVNDQDIAGLTGKLLYPAGVYDATKKYTADEYSAPYVAVKETNESGGDFSYYWLNKESAQGINPITDESNTWKKFNNFQAIYADVLVADFAKIASAVYYQKYMFSQQGVDSDGTASSNYENFLNGFTPNILLDFELGEANFRKINIGGDATFEGVVTAKALYRGIKSIIPYKELVNGFGYDGHDYNNPILEDFIVIRDTSDWDGVFKTLATDLGLSTIPLHIPDPIGYKGKEILIRNGLARSEDIDVRNVNIRITTSTKNATIGEGYIYDTSGGDDCGINTVINNTFLETVRMVSDGTYWVVFEKVYIS